MENAYNQEFSKLAAEAIEQNIAFFLKNGTPIQVHNSFTGNPFDNSAFFKLQLLNDLNGSKHNEFVPLKDVMEHRSSWLTDPQTNAKQRPFGIAIQTNGTNGRPEYAFVTPTALLHQSIIKDKTRPVPRKDYIPYQTNNIPLSNFDACATEHFANIINASLTGTKVIPKFKKNEMKEFSSLLHAKVLSKPSYMAIITNKAFENVLQNNYIPFNRKDFLEKIQNPESKEYKTLLKSIEEHVQELSSGRKPSFNKEFNNMAKPLIVIINASPLAGKEKLPLIRKETEKFINEKIKTKKGSKILIDTLLGTMVAKTLKRNNELSEYLPPEEQKESQNEPQKEAQKSSGPSPFSISMVPGQKDAIQINNRIYSNNDLYRIKNFDTAPFDINGDGVINGEDYMIAYRAQQALFATHPHIYQESKPQTFYQKEQDYNKGTFLNTFITSMIIATGISMAMLNKAEKDTYINNVIKEIGKTQAIKGDFTINKMLAENNTRGLFSHLNYLVKKDPSILKKALKAVPIPGMGIDMPLANQRVNVQHRESARGGRGR